MTGGLDSVMTATPSATARVAVGAMGRMEGVCVVCVWGKRGWPGVAK